MATTDLQNYVRSPQPALPDSQIKYVQEELRKIESSIKSIVNTVTNITINNNNGGTITNEMIVSVDGSKITGGVNITQVTNLVTLLDGLSGDINALDLLLNELGTRIALLDDPNIGVVIGLQAELNNAANQILSLQDGVTNLVGKTDNTLTQVQAIKTTADNATAAIGQINTVTSGSGSAAARQIASVVAQVNDVNTGLPAANANITAINTVSVTSSSASARALAGVQATVNDPTTGLAAAHAGIVALNDVSSTSNSANARYLFGVNAYVGQKNKVFFQTTSPASTSDYTLKVNDIWFNSADNNKMYRWSGSSWVESSDGRIASAQASVTNEATTRVNQDVSLATAINTIWTALGDGQSLVQTGSNGVSNNTGTAASNWTQTQSAIKDPSTGAYISTAAVRTQADTAVTKAGALEAKYTVKVDVNGHVSGFGLASTANNATPTSAFAVRADSFVIAAPAGAYDPIAQYGVVDGAPFVVITTPTTSNGVTYQPGTYIKNAAIVDGSITNAKIGSAAVDTLKIAGNAVTAADYGGSWYSNITLTSTETTILSKPFSVPGVVTDTATVIVNCAVYSMRSGTGLVSYRLVLRDPYGTETELSSYPVWVGDPNTNMLTAKVTISQNASYTLKVYASSASGGSLTSVSTGASMTIIGAKR